MAKNKGVWAAVAVVVVIIIAAALVLTLYGRGANAFKPCIAQPGYTCSSAVYHTSGSITLVVGQSTGYNWAVASLIFVPSTAQYQNGVPVVTWSSATTLHNGLANGATVNATIPATASVYGGTQLNGTIWASYQQLVGGTFYYAEIGSIRALAR